MKLHERLELLGYLHNELVQPSPLTEAVMHRTSVENPWFEMEHIRQSFQSIAFNYLDRDRLSAFVDHYSLDDNIIPRRVGIIMAGNIPLVGFHDWLCVYLAGHKAQIKLSQKDKYLLPHLLALASKKYPSFHESFEIVEKLKAYEAVIATGSNNTNRYFETYFKHVPHLLRKSRTSVAVLDGTESDEEITLLGRDVFQYFGLGCRNVSKIYWPIDFDKERVFSSWVQYRSVLDNTKYKNNFDYNFGLWSLNRIPFYTNDVLHFKADPSYHARIASVHYEEYERVEDVLSQLREDHEQLQCIVMQKEVNGLPTVSFGESQNPALMDYADGADTMKFLLAIN